MKQHSLSIGVITIANLPQGTGRTGRLRSLVGALTGLGHQVSIWNQHSVERTVGQEVFGEVSGAKFEYVLGTTERQWGFRSLPLKLRAVNKIRHKVRQAAAYGKLNVLMFNHLAFYDTFPLTRLVNRLGIPTVQCYEDERRELVGTATFSQKVFGLNSWLADRWCSPMADQIWVISSYLRDKYSALSGHPDKVHIVPTIVDCGQWFLPPEPDQSPPVMLYSGSFTEQDDIEKLAQVLVELKRQNVPFKMRFLGADPQNPRVRLLKSIVHEKHLLDSVELLPFQPAEVVKSEIARSNLLINLRTNSLWGRSGLSTKLSEYLAAGRAVLTTNIGDNALYVQDGESAIVVNPDEPPQRIASSLTLALKNPEFRKKLALGARKAALRHFDVAVVQQTLTKCLNQLEPDPKARRSA